MNPRTGIDHEKLARAIKDLKDSNNKDLFRELIKKLMQIAPSSLYQVVKLHPELKQFLEENPKLNESWSAKLKKNGFFGEQIVSIQSNEYCTVFNQFIGNYLLNAAKKASDPSEKMRLLNEACENKIFDALVMRSEINAENINLGKDVNQSKTQLLADLEILNNLYWQPGQIHSTLILINLAQKLQGISGNNNETNFFYEKSLESVLAAEILDKPERQAPMGLKLFQHIHHGDSIKTITHNKFDNLPEIEKLILDTLKLKTDDKHYEELTEKAAHRFG